MAYRKSTLRKMDTNTRKLARLINDLDSALTRLKNFMPTVEQMELESNALYSRLSTYEKKVFDQEQQQHGQTKVADDLFPQQAEQIQQIALTEPEPEPQPADPEKEHHDL
jgi:hypothetical protein